MASAGPSPRMADTSGDSPVRQWWLEGQLAGAVSTVVLLWRGWAEARAPLGAVNAPSHWVWGREALRRNRADGRHTVLGLLIHQASSLFWALAYRALMRGWGAPTPARAVGGALAVGAMAAVVDLKLVPQRLTPGFERRLSGRSLMLVYLAFAAGLALGGASARRRGPGACSAQAQPDRRR